MKGYAANAIAEATFTVLLLNARKLATEEQSENNDFELKDKNILVFGKGEIGNRIYEIALYEFLKDNKKATYIHIAFPDKEKEELFNKIRNVIFYPLFSNKTKESSLERKAAPLRNLFADMKNR